MSNITYTDEQKKDLASLESCETATNNFSKLLDRNKATAAYNDSQTVKYQAAHAAWVARKNAWNAEMESLRVNKNNRTNNLRGERKDWKNEAFDTECYARDNWCKNDYGDWVDGGTKKDVRWGFCKRDCKRSESNIQAVINDEFGSSKYNNDFNETEPIDKTGEFAYRNEENAKDINISCCSNYLSSGSANVSDVDQSCSMQISQVKQDIDKDAAARMVKEALENEKKQNQLEQDLAAIGASKPVVKPQISPQITPQTTLQTTPQGTPQITTQATVVKAKESNNGLMIGLTIAGFFITISMIISCIVAVRRSRQ